MPAFPVNKLSWIWTISLPYPDFAGHFLRKCHTAGNLTLTAFPEVVNLLLPVELPGHPALPQQIRACGFSSPGSSREVIVQPPGLNVHKK